MPNTASPRRSLVTRLPSASTTPGRSMPGPGLRRPQPVAREANRIRRARHDVPDAPIHARRANADQQLGVFDLGLGDVLSSRTSTDPYVSWMIAFAVSRRSATRAPRRAHGGGPGPGPAALRRGRAAWPRARPSRRGPRSQRSRSRSAWAATARARAARARSAASSAHFPRCPLPDRTSPTAAGDGVDGRVGRRCRRVLDGDGFAVRSTVFMSSAPRSTPAVFSARSRRRQAASSAFAVHMSRGGMTWRPEP
jgi:hypothetical protein